MSAPLRCLGASYAGVTFASSLAAVAARIPADSSLQLTAAIIEADRRPLAGDEPILGRHSERSTRSTYKPTSHSGVCSRLTKRSRASDVQEFKPTAVSNDPWSVMQGVVNIGQSFKASETGVLTGIDASVGQQSCSSNPDAEIELSLYEGVYDGTQTPIATRSILMSSLPNCNNRSALGQGAPGVGYFDLSSDCISLQSGHEYSFMLAAKDPTPATCDMNQFVCTGSGSWCMSDAECRTHAVASVLYVPFVPPGYVDGALISSNLQSGTTALQPDNDLGFVTYVSRP